MRIAVLGSAKGWHVGDLRRAAGDAHEIVVIGYRDLHAVVSSNPLVLGAGPIDLRQCDALLVRSMPPGSLEQVIFRMNVLAELEKCGVRVVNSPRTIEVAVDKCLTTVRLAEHGLLVPRTAVCQTLEQAMENFLLLGGDVVVKPVFGGEGRGIARVTDEAIALRTFKALEQIGAVLYLQEFVAHEGFDIRLLVLGERVLGMRRRNQHDWRTNISRGALAESLEVTDELAELAHRAARAIKGHFVGVDLLPAKDGRLLTIEVNAVPGWRALGGVAQQDVAQLVLDYLSTTVSAGRN